jgi:hypothetical protein
MKEYKNLELKKLALLEQKYSQSYGQPQPAAETAALEVRQVPERPAACLALPGSEPISGIQKFRALVREDREKAVILLKQWIKAASPQADAALAALPHLMETQELVGLLPYLKLEERRAWKRMVDNGASTEALALADGFISSQVLSALMSCHPEFEDELVTKVSELTLEQCLEIANEDASLGAVLAMILPGSQLASFYNRLRPEVVNEVIETIMMIKEDRTKEYSQRLRATIEKMIMSEPTAMPAERVDDLLRNAKPEHEAAIFELLGRTGNFALLEQTARQFFPSELVPKLPASVLKACLARFPIERQAEIIFSRDQERQIFLQAIGTPGSKSRDMIDVEINRLAADQARAKRASKQAGDLWKGFVEAVRGFLKNDEEAMELAGEVLGPWLASRQGGSDGLSAA